MFEAVGRGGQRITVWPAKQLVVVFTGGGFEPGDLAGFILRALKSSEALPPNADATRRLLERIRRVTNAPPERIVSVLPPMAERISGKAFTLSTNTTGFTSISLRFNRAVEAEAEFVLENRRLTFPLGLDGVGRFSPNAIVKLPQIASGRWISNDTFVLELDLVGGINHYTVTLKFAKNGQQLKGQLTERTGLAKEAFEGRLSN